LFEIDIKRLFLQKPIVAPCPVKSKSLLFFAAFFRLSSLKPLEIPVVFLQVFASIDEKIQHNRANFWTLQGTSISEYIYVFQVKSDSLLRRIKKKESGRRRTPPTGKLKVYAII